MRSGPSAHLGTPRSSGPHPAVVKKSLPPDQVLNRCSGKSLLVIDLYRCLVFDRRVSESVKLFQGDAVTWLGGLPAGTVDLVVTDPPYESLEKHRAVGTTTRLKQSKASSNPWFRVFPNARFPELF